MINSGMREYNYYTYATFDEYGQPILTKEPQGKVKMNISVLSQGTQDNILYENSTYLGLTVANVNSTYVIEYGDMRLKVMYVNPNGRLKQVFMAGMQ